MHESRSHPELLSIPPAGLPCPAQGQGLQPTAAAGAACQYEEVWLSPRKPSAGTGLLNPENVTILCLKANHIYVQKMEVECKSSDNTTAQYLCNHTLIPTAHRASIAQIGPSFSQTGAASRATVTLASFVIHKDICHCISLVLERCQKKRLPAKFRVYFCPTAILFLALLQHLEGAVYSSHKLAKWNRNETVNSFKYSFLTFHKTNASSRQKEWSLSRVAVDQQKTSSRQ